MSCAPSLTVNSVTNLCLLECSSSKSILPLVLSLTTHSLSDVANTILFLLLIIIIYLNTPIFTEFFYYPWDSSTWMIFLDLNELFPLHYCLRIYFKWYLQGKIQFNGLNFLLVRLLLERAGKINEYHNVPAPTEKSTSGQTCGIFHLLPSGGPTTRLDWEPDLHTHWLMYESLRSCKHWGL